MDSGLDFDSDLDLVPDIDMGLDLDLNSGMVTTLPFKVNAGEYSASGQGSGVQAVFLVCWENSEVICLTTGGGSAAVISFFGPWRELWSRFCLLEHSAEPPQHFSKSLWVLEAAMLNGGEVFSKKPCCSIQPVHHVPQPDNVQGPGIHRLSQDRWQWSRITHGSAASLFWLSIL